MTRLHRTDLLARRRHGRGWNRPARGHYRRAELRNRRRELGDRVRTAYREEVDRTHRSLLNAAVAFAFTFGLVRLLTYGIREDWLPWGNVVAGDVHIHHYVWGVALLLVIGLVSLVIDSPRLNPLLGAVYGVAAALVIDEFALLLNLRDVYWSTEGRISVDLALGTIALAAIYFAATSFWRRLGRELLRDLRQRRRARS
jgi:hypothetical protein